jgi:hypothetical protein
MIQRRSLLIGAGATGVAAAAPAWAQQTKSGTVQIEQVQVAFIGSANVGSGTLNFQGKSYRFTVGGLGAGGYGISRMQAFGDVYDLKQLNQFPGAYGQARSGITVGDMSAGQLWMRNTHGVTIGLHAKRQGLALSLGGDAVYIDFK